MAHRRRRALLYLARAPQRAGQGQLVARPARRAGDVRRSGARRVHHDCAARFGAFPAALVRGRRRLGGRAGCLRHAHAFDLRRIDVARHRGTRENVFNAVGVLVVPEGNAGRRRQGSTRQSAPGPRRLAFETA